MLDFLKIATKPTRTGVDVYPKFVIRNPSSDLMIRGGDFYAVWAEDLGRWSTSEQDVIRLVDEELSAFVEEHKQALSGNVQVKYMWDAESGSIDAWHRYCQKQMRDQFKPLDEQIIFANDETSKKDYATKKLDYALAEGDISAYDKIMSILYSPEERHKIEYAIGAVVTGDSKKLQKFLVFYGAAGTGKSTVLNIIQKLFEGYYAVFDAKALGSSSDSFALEAFKTNPLIAIQHDGDLSRIEDNTRLNSLVSHELMTVNEKFKSTYSNRFNSFLFMGTNKPVKITDGRSGLLRRLIDVSPTGNKLPYREYLKLMKQIDFELGAIAWYCREVYWDDPDFYDDYIPISMMGASNDFYNFVDDNYIQFSRDNQVTLKAAWELYKQFCDDTKVQFPLPQRLFKEELKNYFKDFIDKTVDENGNRIRNLYKGFKKDKIDGKEAPKKKPKAKDSKNELSNNLIEQDSLFDKVYSDCLAQYANEKGTPTSKWESVTTKLKDLDTSKLHYVQIPDNLIVIDFDIKDENGNKSFELNLEAASKWPATYMEVSQSGSAIHLHYIYDGDVLKLSRVYDDEIEIKVYTGNSALRRRLTKCNNEPIAHISSGLPLKGEKVINSGQIKSEKSLRSMIIRNLNKEIHPATRPSIDFIKTILDEAYNSDLKYDVSDMRTAVFNFASHSTHQSDYCMRLVPKMKFKSEDTPEAKREDDGSDENPLIFFDCEVFPNLFVVVWKERGADKKCVRLINPKPYEIENLVKYKLVGFNNRRYDNHILYGAMLGYSNEALYNLSRAIVAGQRNAFFGNAYNLSYTDVYDFCSVKQSLKKWEIDLGIHHQELGLPWDQPVPEELWITVAEYCDNDVIAAEAVFEARQADFTARKILAELANSSVNDTTNSLSAKIIFGNNKHPQNEFNYRFMGCEDIPIDMGGDEYTLFEDGKPLFPGYKFENGVSSYRDVKEVGEGGRVFAKPGIWFNLALLDIASMHPSSVVAENLFGDVYTKRFQDILEARKAIKHKEIDRAKGMLDGVLAKYLDDPKIAKDLAYALKIVINSIYGLTSAKFDNPFRDARNVDNIVAKRGALFMINLQHEVLKRGFEVAHIKTDSIKIPDATMDIIDFVMEYGKLYGYAFEHEATYERMCLVNDAVYIAKYASSKYCLDTYGYVPEKNAEDELKWTATGTQFQVPYVFKYLFSKEPITFEDMCETKQVTSSLYLDMNESLPDVSKWEMVRDLRIKSTKATKKELAILEELSGVPDIDILEEIKKGHDYRFIGKVGSFCPVVAGTGGGILCRDTNGKYTAPPGTSGYRWLESEMVKSLGLEDKIDKSYYSRLVDDAVSEISKYGDFDQFAA